MSNNQYYEDMELVCQEENCGEAFIWTGGEQKFMQALQDEGKITEVVQPKRCPKCRKAKKARFANK